MAGVESNGDYSTKVYNNESGVFTPFRELPGRSGDIAWGDYDNDGYLDALVGGRYVYNNADGLTELYRYTGAGFSSAGTSLPDVSGVAFAWGDCDNDGDLDLFVSGSPGYPSARIARIYENDSGVFTAQAHFSGVCAGSAAFADYDNDGDLDLLFSGDTGSGYITKLLINNGSYSSAPLPTAPSNLFQSNITDESASLNWVPSPGNATLSYNLRIGTSPMGEEIKAGLADLNDGIRLVAGMGNVNHATNWIVRGLVEGSSYYWSVQTVDGSFIGGEWAEENVFSTGYSVEWSTLGHGAVSAEPYWNASASNTTFVAPGNILNLQATTDSGWLFTGWSGDLAGNYTTTNTSMIVDRSIVIIAHFSLDADNDGLSNSDELSYETDPYNGDSDFDGLTDGQEVFTYFTNPSVADTDGDGFSDLFEINTGYLPTSATSTPEMKSTILTAIEFQFNAATGVEYQIEATDNLSTPWEIIESGISGQGNVVKRLYSLDGQPNRYFRAKRN
jgi:hypothetical protein